MADPVFHPISGAFLANVANCTHNETTGHLWFANVAELHLVASESGGWALGLVSMGSGFTISASTFAELTSATPERDANGETGNYTINAGATVKALYADVDAGAALPGDVPDPPPPPPG